MCGRYSVTRFDTFRPYLPEIDWESLDLEPRAACAPTQMLPIAYRGPTGWALDLAHWSLIPPWSDSRKLKISTFNAKAETLAESKLWSPPFKRPVPGQRGRCLVPADSFFEWQKVAGGKQPLRIRRADGQSLALAGLYSAWHDRELEQAILSFTIVTCPPNSYMAAIHDRMPVILASGDARAWATAPWEEASALCRPCADELLVAEPVSAAETRA